MKKFLVAIAALLLVSGQAFAQPKDVEKSAPQDSAIVFESARPLLETQEELDARLDNGWGFGAFFSDYGFGAGVYLSARLSQDLTGLITTDFGTAKSEREFGFETERKVNRIMVMPVMAAAQYRILRESVGENFRPYITAGAGPVVVMTSPGNEEFFSSLGRAQFRALPGGFAGAGANFGLDKTTNFGANIRYFFIPVPEPGIESLQGEYLTN
ncbi:MAG TPA: hypothetical protein VEF04_22195, partial [Blastocatellia bacterium]|nr:hypothetical protein [Blastocatellia bacterium]